MKKIIYISIISLLLAACSTTKVKTSKNENSKTPMVPVPEGMQFEKRTNYNAVLASINMPVSGSEFKTKKADTPEGGTSYYFTTSMLNIYPTLDNFEGTLDEQIENAKKPTRFGPRVGRIKSTSVIAIDKKKIGNREVARIDISDIKDHGYGSLNYGYLVPNGNKATLLIIKDIYITPETDINAYRKSLDDAFVYMIKTLEFK